MLQRALQRGAWRRAWHVGVQLGRSSPRTNCSPHLQRTAGEQDQQEGLKLMQSSNKARSHRRLETWVLTMEAGSGSSQENGSSVALRQAISRCEHKGERHPVAA